MAALLSFTGTAAGSVNVATASLVSSSGLVVTEISADLSDAEKVAAAEQQLRSRDQQLHFNSDSENEEFLNTIETQRLQLLALEDSLRQEKDNFAQLQRVLQVERGRGRREAELGGAQLDQALAREKQKYSDLHTEYELLKRARYGQQHI